MTASRYRMLASLVLAACGFGSIAPAHATIYRVGSGSGCTHSNIQAAVDTARNNPGRDFIRVTETLNYSQQRVLIRNNDLQIEGGFANCKSTASSGVRTWIDGAGGLAASVFVIESSPDVTLLDLNIFGGDSHDFGGGIAIAGISPTTVILRNTRVGQSSALDGGGISVLGSTANPVSLVMDTDSVVEGNTARRAGGGIFCRNATVSIVGARTRVGVNRADTGGGIDSTGCQVTITASSRYADGGTIFSNYATTAGGGIAARENSLVLLFTTDANAPVGITQNWTGGFGGAAHVIDSWLDIREGIVDGNRADLGGGGAYVQARKLSTGLNMLRITSGLPGAVSCAIAMRCNRLTNNVARMANGMNSHGAALMLMTEAGDSPPSLQVEIGAATIAGNQGHTLVRAGDATTAPFFLFLADSEVYGNSVAANLFEFVAQSPVVNVFRFGLELESSSIAGNTIGGQAVIFQHGTTAITHSIIWQPGRRVLAAGSAPVSSDALRYSMVSDVAGFSPPLDVWVANPRFVDAAAGNLRLSTDSPAIDFAPAEQGFRSRDGGARSVDLFFYPNRFGPQDLGAFERQTEPGSSICCALIGGG